MGVTAVWIPPAYKGKEQNDVGYGTYDLFDPVSYTHLLEPSGYPRQISHSASQVPVVSNVHAPLT